VILRKGQQWVEINTEVVNVVEDHYLQVCFPTGLHFEHVCVQGQFDVLNRPVEVKLEPASIELPMSEAPLNSFVDATDGTAGLALLNEGLKAYEAGRDAAGTVSLTLLRAYPLRICVTQEMTDYSQSDKGTQCLGTHHFRYAVMPHAGDCAAGKVWMAAEQFNLALQACQLSPTPHGTEPLEKSFLELLPEGLHVSAVKRSESGRGWIVRLFNPADGPMSGRLRLNGGLSGPAEVKSPVEFIQSANTLPEGKGRPWQTVRQVSLEELPQADLSMDEKGWVAFEIGKKQILTLEFLTDDPI
jgi:mannosylglycerate hydrolase